VDGEEDIGTGLDLHELAEILVQWGTWQAVVSSTFNNTQLLRQGFI